MNKGHYYRISKENFYTLLSNLSREADVYIPVKKGDYLCYERFNSQYKGEYIVDQIRPIEPLKSFLNPSRERVDIQGRARRQILVGVKNCDVTSLKIQDFVFKETDPPDPFYTQKRENTIIISCDCNLLWENCFCVALDINPYPQEGFDINLSRYMEGFVVETGSEKGAALIDRNKDLFSEATDIEIKNKLNYRASLKDSLKDRIKEKKTPGKDSIKESMKKSFPVTDIWADSASACIECGGCNHCCPTCHCFFLSDQKKEDLKVRYKSWDACLYNRFARVAGGANPRRHLKERLRNRFDKKFEFFPNVLGMFACTGCGRCIEVCPGKIDIREVLKRVVQGK